MANAQLLYFPSAALFLIAWLAKRLARVLANNRFSRIDASSVRR